MTENDTIRWERGDDGVVVLTLDDPNQSANTMNEAYVALDGAHGRAPRGREGRHRGRRDHLRARAPSSPAATSTT